MNIHHIAIKTQNLENLNQFYKKVFNFKEDQRWYDDNGKIRSIWLNMHSSLLMLEQAQSNPNQTKSDSKYGGWHLLSFDIKLDERVNWKNKLNELGISLKQESSYSLFFEDPEGNRLALSHYPNKFEIE